MGELRPLLVLMAPSEREGELREYVDAETCVVTWESVMRGLKTASGLDPVSQVLRDEYLDFLRNRLEFLPGFKLWHHHLARRWKPRGTPEQRQLLRSVSGLLNEPSSRMGTGDTWAGYYFLPRGEEHGRSWLGFVPASRARPKRDGALLVMAGDDFPSDLPARCRRVELEPAIWLDGRHVQAVEITIDEALEVQAVWRELFADLGQQESVSQD